MENHWKNGCKISISTVISLIWVTNHFLIRYHFAVNPVNLSTPFFGNINLRETMPNCCLKTQSKMVEIISICILNSLNYLKTKFIYDVSFTLWPGKSVIPDLNQYQSGANNFKFACCLENHWKWLQNIYFHRSYFNISYKSFSLRASLSRRGPVNLSTTTFYNIILTETMQTLPIAWKFNQKWLK